MTFMSGSKMIAKGLLTPTPTIRLLFSVFTVFYLFKSNCSSPDGIYSVVNDTLYYVSHMPASAFSPKQMLHRMLIVYGQQCVLSWHRTGVVVHGETLINRVCCLQQGKRRWIMTSLVSVFTRMTAVTGSRLECPHSTTILSAVSQHCLDKLEQTWSNYCRSKRSSQLNHTSVCVRLYYVSFHFLPYLAQKPFRFYYSHSHGITTNLLFQCDLKWASFKRTIFPSLFDQVYF